MSEKNPLPRLGVAILAAGVVLAGIMFPFAGLIGYTSTKTLSSLEQTSAQLLEGTVPAVTTIQDVNGATIAHLFDQNRIEVPGERISPQMKKAIISIEDHRFFEHNGVDWQGTGRALLTNLTSGQVRQGASTLNQQYVKNYQLLVTARTDAERASAVATTSARKVREIRMATQLDAELPKDEILTRYLNLVPFGNGAYGIETAAQTYFGISAAELNLPQSALLAGMVQSTSGLNPYTNANAALARRNTVIDSMLQWGAISAAEGAAAKATDLGVLPEPRRRPHGCIAATDRGFFCDYVITWLGERGFSREELLRGGYTIRTTLDPVAQDATRDALARNANPQAPGVAEVMSLIRPGRESHDVVAIGSSREYGLDQARHQTVQPQPFSPVGHGAGSVFKIFAVAAAMEKGMGTNGRLAVPARYQATGLGSGGAPGCPPNTYCVQNSGNYATEMTVTQALAQSPNTPFVRMIGDVGVPQTVDMAVRLGMRSLTKPRSHGDQSIAEFVSENNLGSFVLGPVAVNNLELSNVAATLASGGKWCEPNPVVEMRDRKGQPVPIQRTPCEQVVPEGLANTLAVALSEDVRGSGTAAGAAGASRWTLPVSAKTGTTEAHYSSAFLAFTNQLAGSVYAYNDSTTTTELCSSPLRQCRGGGGLFGGMEPARTWLSAVGPIATHWGPVQLPAPDPEYQRGTAGRGIPHVVGMDEATATSTLRAAGYRVSSQRVPGTGARAGTVTGTDAGASTLPGGTVTIFVSDGSAPPRPEPTPGGDLPQLPPIELPGLPPIIIPN